jgi:uncharacterized membrane protein
MTDSRDMFEMRRFEALSNTVFGVAMTLLAYDLPRSAAFSSAPTWGSLAHAYLRPLIALSLSFLVAGIFWLSHHRRLAQAPYASRGVVMLNILFLMTIVLLPATTGLYGAHQANSVTSTVYAGLLAIIASLNALLWFLALPNPAAGFQFWSALAPALVFIVAICVAPFNPTAAQYVMPCAFLAPFLGWFLSRREQKG